jgi:hypothetical protein
MRSSLLFFESQSRVCFSLKKSGSANLFSLKIDSLLPSKKLNLTVHGIGMETKQYKCATFTLVEIKTTANDISIAYKHFARRIVSLLLLWQHFILNFTSLCQSM